MSHAASRKVKVNIESRAQERLKIIAEACRRNATIKDYLTSSNLRRHWHHPHRSLCCEWRDAHFSLPADERKHVESRHWVCKRMTCFQSQQGRSSHWASSKARKWTYCRLCRLDFPNPVRVVLILESLSIDHSPSNGDDTSKNTAKDKTKDQKTHPQATSSSSNSQKANSSKDASPSSRNKPNPKPPSSTTTPRSGSPAPAPRTRSQRPREHDVLTCIWIDSSNNTLCPSRELYDLSSLSMRLTYI